MADYNLACRVCGLLNEDPPWGADGKTPLFEYCLCCGVESGYGDATPTGAQRWRQRWIEGGAVWHEPRFKPNNWDMDEQFANIPPDFR